MSAMCIYDVWRASGKQPSRNLLEPQKSLEPPKTERSGIKMTQKRMGVTHGKHLLYGSAKCGLQAGTPRASVLLCLWLLWAGPYLTTDETVLNSVLPGSE